MPTNPSPDPRSSMWAWIARDLRMYRIQRGQSGQAVATMLNLGRSSISRLENGDTRLEEDQAAILDKEWETGGHFSLLVWYASKGHDPDWFRQHLDIESRALLIRVYEALIMPALFQLPEYARALLMAGGVAETDRLVEERMSRQEILNRNPPPLLWVLLTESVLTWPVGGRDVMKRQLARLLEASESSNVSVRVVPRSAGAHVGLGGSFKVMSVESGDVAYTDALGGGRLVPSAAEVRSYLVWYDRIGQQALPDGPSRDLIRQVMEAM